ncbi:hypothetical protein Vadar_001785 [Vaccinium darrowii]|uniref:Uncharacterized protein n=1 Tax=Vaccinium darrowii TaxID=229202 RepID=A0ACB7XML6_9ERIC|nr:hypothetical protein Vadar_001785 [Vaccinium darrowii]
MESDAKAHVRRCHACQKFGNLVHAPVVELHAIRAPYPFHTWAMDLVGPITPHSRKHQWILAATEVSTKWVEAVPLKKATGAAVAQFIKENIICRFGIPKVILSDNGTPFINKDVGELLQSYSAEHQTSTPYYPQGNGQAEATNKSLVQILSKLLDEKGGTWSDHLITALWAYRTAKRKATRTSPFNLVYGAETVLPVELSVPSARLALSTEATAAERRADLEALEERQELAAEHQAKYWESVSRFYNKSMVPREFKVGDLVWKSTTDVMRNVKLPKFTPRWEGPYQVINAGTSGHYRLSRVSDGFLTGPINIKFMKKYYP